MGVPATLPWACGGRCRLWSRGRRVRLRRGRLRCSCVRGGWSSRRGDMCAPSTHPPLSSSAALLGQDEPTLTGAGGETDARVSHYLAEWEDIEGQRLLFVGGGFSSADGVARLCGRNQCAWVTRKPQAQIDSMLYDQRTKCKIAISRSVVRSVSLSLASCRGHVRGERRQHGFLLRERGDRPHGRRRRDPTLRRGQRGGRGAVLAVRPLLHADGARALVGAGGFGSVGRLRTRRRELGVDHAPRVRPNDARAPVP